jgi:LPXTG-site transpeptidase (sortase) family protein
MQFGIRRRKWSGKDLGSWLIILGYVTIVVGVVTVTRDWTLKSVVSDPKASISVASKGFVPYLDSLDPQPILAKGSGISHSQGRYMAPTAMLEPLAPWEIGQLSENNPSEGIIVAQNTGLDLERWLPESLEIPKIGLDVSIVPAKEEEVEILGESYRQWLAPDARVVGWQPESATLGVPGNTVLIGHHNVHGEVFRELDVLEVGDLIRVYSDEMAFEYQVSLKMTLPEKFESIENRLENARWIHATQDERLTLVTCWPYETNTHRMILVAEPVLGEQ